VTERSGRRVLASGRLVPSNSPRAACLIACLIAPGPFAKTSEGLRDRAQRTTCTCRFTESRSSCLLSPFTSLSSLASVTPLLTRLSHSPPHSPQSLPSSLAAVTPLLTHLSHSPPHSPQSLPSSLTSVTPLLTRLSHSPPHSPQSLPSSLTSVSPLLTRLSHSSPHSPQSLPSSLTSVSPLLHSPQSRLHKTSPTAFAPPTVEKQRCKPCLILCGRGHLKGASRVIVAGTSLLEPQYLKDHEFVQTRCAVVQGHIMPDPCMAGWFRNLSLSWSLPQVTHRSCCTHTNRTQVMRFGNSTTRQASNVRNRPHWNMKFGFV
jgi:hypothetical protein